MSREQEPQPSTNPYAAPRAALADTPPEGPSPAERKWFFRSFWISFGLGGLALTLLLGGHDVLVFVLSFFATLVAGIVHLACLGRVALRTGRSPLLWVLGAVLFAPFGYLIAFARMSTLIGLEEEEQPGEALRAE